MHTVIVGTNSWCSVAYADSYFDSQFNRAVWAAISFDNRSRCLIHAFKWIMQQPDFTISPSDTTDKIKQIQCELAWFVNNYFSYYEKNRTMVQSSLKSHDDMDFSENFRDTIEFPEFISKMLLDHKNTGGILIEMKRENEVNV